MWGMVRSLLSLFGWGSLNAEIDKVQAATVKACKFLPTVSTVASILTSGNPAVASASGVAAAICASLKASASVKHLSSGDGPRPQVNGVPVEGWFIS